VAGPVARAGRCGSGRAGSPGLVSGGLARRPQSTTPTLPVSARPTPRLCRTR